MESLLKAQRPKYPQYAVPSERLKSYKKWPKFCPVDPGKLADSGFFFTGVGDLVRCYHCGGGFRNWEEGDDPWVEHARLFPDCGHILLVKGQKYVQQVIQGNVPEENNTISGQDEKSQALQKTTSQKPKQLGKKPQHAVLSRREVTTYPPQDPVDPVESVWIGVSGRCYQCGGVLMIRVDGDTMWDEHARMHPNCGHILLRTLQKNNDQILQGNSQVEIFSEHEESSQEKDQASEDPMQSIAVQSCLEMGFDPQFVQAAVELLISSHGHSNFEGSDIATIALEIEEGKITPPSRNMFDSSQPRTDGIQSEEKEEEQEDPETLKKLVEENARLKENKVCKICLDDLANIIFLPCGHMVSCPMCAPAFLKCPICRKSVKRYVKAFFE